jgi:hypothetical protein
VAGIGPRDPRSCELDINELLNGASQSPVTCEQTRIEGLGESHIDGVIGREVASQIPDPRQQEVMRISANGKIGKVGKSRSTALVVEGALGGITAKDLYNFDVQKVRRMQSLLRPEKTSFNCGGPRRAKNNFKHR